jgi:glutamate formiminotransferase
MIEAVPNISEGRNRETIDAVAAAIRTTPSVHLLHVTSDGDHHRSVFTYVSKSAEAIVDATLRMYEAAFQRIDLRNHRGEHPRVGAVDVIPFVPLRQTTMAECVAIAEKTGATIAERFGVPIYLYEEAAREESRRELPKIRSGGFEKFAKKIEDPRWTPDFGPAVVHPTAGVTIVGARVPLIAFNVQLGTDQLGVADKIARKVRASSGGLPFVRALPINLTRRGVVQVSMNLLNYRATPISQAFTAVREEAERQGVEVISSEIVGLVPAEAVDAESAARFKIENYSPEIVLERRIAAAESRPGGM